jgi:hypothetical protein
VRQLIEIPAQSKAAIVAVEQAEKDCEQWRDDRDSNQDRFDVNDPRPRSAIQAERALSAAILESREKKKRQEGSPKENNNSNNSRPNSRPNSRISRMRKHNQVPTTTNNSNGLVASKEDLPASKEEQPQPPQPPQPQQAPSEQPIQLMAAAPSHHSELAMDEGSALVEEEAAAAAVGGGFPRAPLPRRHNLMQYTSSSNAGNVIGLSEDVKNAQGIGGFWRDQNPDISAPTSTQMVTEEEDPTIQAVLSRDDSMVVNQRGAQQRGAQRTSGKTMVSSSSSSRAPTFFHTPFELPNTLLDFFFTCSGGNNTHMCSFFSLFFFLFFFSLLCAARPHWQHGGTSDGRGFGSQHGQNIA